MLIFQMAAPLERTSQHQPMPFQEMPPLISAPKTGEVNSDPQTKKTEPPNSRTKNADPDAMALEFYKRRLGTKNANWQALALQDGSDAFKEVVDYMIVQALQSLNRLASKDDRTVAVPSGKPVFNSEEMMEPGEHWSMWGINHGWISLERMGNQTAEGKTKDPAAADGWGYIANQKMEFTNIRLMAQTSGKKTKLVIEFEGTYHLDLKNNLKQNQEETTVPFRLQYDLQTRELKPLKAGKTAAGTQTPVGKFMLRGLGAQSPQSKDRNANLVPYRMPAKKAREQTLHYLGDEFSLERDYKTSIKRDADRGAFEPYDLHLYLTPPAPATQMPAPEQAPDYHFDATRTATGTVQVKYELAQPARALIVMRPKTGEDGQVVLDQQTSAGRQSVTISLPSTWESQGQLLELYVDGKLAATLQPPDRR